MSLEPLLGPVDLRRVGKTTRSDDINSLTGWRTTYAYKPNHEWDCAVGVCVSKDDNIRALDAVVVGGESGAKARACSVEWIRDIVGQCKRADASCFVKQLGSHVRIPYYDSDEWDFDRTDIRIGDVSWDPDLDGQPPIGSDCRIRLRSSSGSNPDEWPSDLRVRDLAWEAA